VASERVDAVIAMVWKMARGTARDLVLSEAVTVNGRLVLSPADLLREGDRVSVRGRGKFIYRGTGGKTRKGRLYAAVQVYC
jgi:RNA-binding protein YlmH